MEITRGLVRTLLGSAGTVISLIFFIRFLNAFMHGRSDAGGGDAAIKAVAAAVESGNATEVLEEESPAMETEVME